MFLQNYMYQAATAIYYAHEHPEKLHTHDDKSTAINWDAIHYGNLELRANARRYLHFALPCMAEGIWARGLKKDTVTYSKIESKTSKLGRFLNKLCYIKRDVKVNEEHNDDIIHGIYLDAPLTAQEAKALKDLLFVPQLAPAGTKNIPFFDDGHGYNFFKDNTPFDASRNLLLSEAHMTVENDPSRHAPIPTITPVFSVDDYFVIDRFATEPNGCLGPTLDGSIAKKMKLMMGPDCVTSISTTSIKDLREMGLWRPTEFDQLMLTDGTSIAGTLKSKFKGITAPMALYWTWCQKVASHDSPLNTVQWIHKELCDRISANEVHTVMLDKGTHDWLVEHGIVRDEGLVDGDYFIFPNFDRNRYGSRSAAEAGLTLEQWAWSSGHAVKIPQGLGSKVVGLQHEPYKQEWDPVTEKDKHSRKPTFEVTPGMSTDISAYSRMRNIRNNAIAGLSSMATDFLNWSLETMADVDDFFGVVGTGSDDGEETKPVAVAKTPPEVPVSARGRLNLEVAGSTTQAPAPKPKETSKAVIAPPPNTGAVKHMNLGGD